MPLTTAGRDFIATAIMNDGPPTFFDNTNAEIGVGNSSAVFSAAHTDLQGASKLRKGMEASFPSIATNVLTFKSEFTTAEANYIWDEWAVFNAAAAGVMLSRKVEALGTKTAAQTWQITVTLDVLVGA